MPIASRVDENGVQQCLNLLIGRMRHGVAAGSFSCLLSSSALFSAAG
jgi:hypothetical protein